MTELRVPLIRAGLGLLFLLGWVSCLVASDEFYVTHGQAEEFLHYSGSAVQGEPLEDDLLLAREKILEHTLLALAWDSRKQPLTREQLDELAAIHVELAIRMTRKAWTRVREVSETEVSDYAMLADPLYHTSHILVSDAALADSLHALLLADGDFELLARTFSEDPGSAEQGGLLGPVEAGQTVTEFERALFSLKPGEIGNPVETPFGWHIIRLNGMTLRDLEQSPGLLGEYREILERHARRDAELAASDSLWRGRSLKIYPQRALAENVPGIEIVAQSRDTVLTREQMDQMIVSAFGDRAGLMGENLAAEFLRFWLEQDAWLRAAKVSGIYDGGDVLDRMDLHERLLKSRLLVTTVLPEQIAPTEQDLTHYLANHGDFFLAERSFDLWTLEYGNQRSAENAVALIDQGTVDPEELAGLTGGTATRAERPADEVRALPEDLRNALIELDPGDWSQVLNNGKRGRARTWMVVQLIERSMPKLNESESLRNKVEEQLRAELMTREIGRIVAELRELTGWKRPVWID